MEHALGPARPRVDQATAHAQRLQVFKRIGDLLVGRSLRALILALQSLGLIRRLADQEQIHAAVLANDALAGKNLAVDDDPAPVVGLIQVARHQRGVFGTREGHAGSCGRDSVGASIAHVEMRGALAAWGYGDAPWMAAGNHVDYQISPGRRYATTCRRAYGRDAV